ncbi:hypothetical protein OAE95_02300 [Akkermansiaceae bacterium]|nr:hypothetical protein [bacterium]MDA7935513.1 hypothetical protein [Akkermansiaceae bacterium]MDB4041177.1 hypothetical protein [Akkermansiaceae bacterium]MDB4276277.1 hypothetical protein [Akkermansiaceae bacterium]MDB4287464.1 hypothetical protein [bacterium]
MKLGDDLPPFWIYFKGALFLLILILSSGLVLVVSPWSLRILPLLCVIWSSARLYYFLFYVIEKYIDPQFRFSGLFSVLQYLFRKK